MVDFGQLRDALPEMWQRAADGWRAEAAHAAHCTDIIRARGVGPVSRNWLDGVGQNAAVALRDLGDAFECAATEMRGAVMVLDGLAESIGIAQSTLHGGIDDAARSGLVIDAAGRVSRPPEALATPGDGEVIPRVQHMIDEALREATQADEIAARAMTRIHNGTTVTNPGQAADIDQNADSRDQMAMLAGDAPLPGNPQLAGQWWQALSQPQRDAYERAEPVTIARLDGIPDDERTKMAQGDPAAEPDTRNTGVNRVGFVGYALDHAFDTSIDRYDTDCANFVSTGLNNSGINQELPGDPKQDGWYQGPRTGFRRLDRGIHSRSWSLAQGLHDRLLQFGGTTVQKENVQPGDVLFFQPASGEIGHAAVVTAVTPDGDIKYSQHSNPAQNSSLDGRELHHSSTEWDTGVVAIRPHGPLGPDPSEPPILPVGAP